MPGYANPQNLNRYSYVNNNPLRYTDPTGHMLVENEFGGGKKGCSDAKYCSNGKPKSKAELDKMRKENEKDKDAERALELCNKLAQGLCGDRNLPWTPESTGYDYSGPITNIEIKEIDWSPNPTRAEQLAMEREAGILPVWEPPQNGFSLESAGAECSEDFSCMLGSQRLVKSLFKFFIRSAVDPSDFSPGYDWLPEPRNYVPGPCARKGCR